MLNRFMMWHVRQAERLPLGWLPTVPLWALTVMQVALWVGLGLTLYAQYRIGF